MKSLVADLLVTYETVDRPEATPINPNDKTLSLSITDSYILNIIDSGILCL